MDHTSLTIEPRSRTCALRRVGAILALLVVTGCGGGDGSDSSSGGNQGGTPVGTAPPSSPPVQPSPNPPSANPPPVVNIENERQRALNESMLADHNRAREEMGVPLVTLDAELSAQALAYSEVLAANGRFEHSANDDRRGQGENLWRGTAGAFGHDRMFSGWYNEKEHFVPGRFPDVSRTNNWADVGHYTQIIWRTTTRIGCGVATGNGWDVVTCRYAPPGNVVGQLVI